MGTVTEIPRWEELEERIGRKLYSLSELVVKGIVNIDSTTLNKIMKDKPDWIQDICYEVGVDVQAKKQQGYSRVKYALDAEKLVGFFDKHKSVAEIAKMAGIHKATIGKYLKSGKLGDIPSKHYSSYMLYNAEEMLKRIKEIQIDSYEGSRRKRSNLTDIYDSHLPKEILEMIDRYIKHRLSKMPGITIGGLLVNKNGFVKGSRGEYHQQTLKSIFFEIICTIEVVEFNKEIKLQLQSGQISSFKGLDRVSKTDFSLDDFDDDTVEILSERFDGLTLQNFLVDVLKPFYFYFLMVKEKEMLKTKRKSNLSFEERYILQENFEILKMGILDVFNKIFKHDPEPELKKRVFLTREQYALLYKKVFEKQGISKMVALELSFRLGLRATEATLVAVEDFWIDENGFLLTDENGFGWLYLPAVKSKGGKNGGAEERGKLVPPDTVKTINLYLKDIYSKCPFETHKKDAGRTFTSSLGKKVYEEGHGFLLRDYRFIKVFDKSISKTWISSYLKKIRGECSFLSPDQRKYLSYHDGRHSLNEWIETANVGPNLQGYLDFIADFQMHHSGSRDVGKQKYRNKDITEVYAEIINKSINFPLNLHELRKWEIEHLYRAEEDTEVMIGENTFIKIKTDDLNVINPYDRKPAEGKTLSTEETQRLAERLLGIKEQLTATIQKPSNMGAIEWSKYRVKLNEEKEKIEKKLNS